MIIRNGLVYGEDCTFSARDLYVENGIIAADEEQVTDASEIDASGLYVLPGLVDIHSHGAAGHDFSDGNTDGLHQILQYQFAHGITSYCPTSMSLPEEQLKSVLAAVRYSDKTSSHIPAKQQKSALSAAGNAAADSSTSIPEARIAGIHLEGPFLDPEKKGAHREDCLIPPDISLFREWNKACSHLIRLITLAPNLPGTLEFIRAVHGETVISLGHTSADYDICKAALEAGASHITHLCNAMAPLNHRNPGLIGAAADHPGCVAELICDGIHIHPSMVRALFKLFPGRIALISDSMRATGLADGSYDLGGQQVTVTGQLATLADGTIAGSVTNLYDCMRNAVSFGIPLEEAVAAATIIPARSIGIDHTVGSLTPGKHADILLANRNLQLVKVICNYSVPS